MEVIVLQNEIDLSGLRQLHIMSSKPIDQMRTVQEWARTEHPIRPSFHASTDELRLYHLVATWLAREPVYYVFDQEGTGKLHPMVVWALLPGQRIGEAAIDAALTFFDTFEFWPSVAWIRTWPKGLKVEDAYMPLGNDIGMDLFAVPWAGDGFVVVGGGFNQNRR